MTTLNKQYMTQAQQFGGVPFGNLVSLPFHFETNSSGVMLDQNDLATAVQSGDVVRLGILPAGLELQDSNAIISDAFTAATTASIGFAYVDGVDSTSVPQSATYFNSAQATSSLAIARKTATTAPVVLPKDAYLILTIGGAAHASAGIMDIAILGVNKGA